MPDATGATGAGAAPLEMFIPMRVPYVTHNDLVAVMRGPRGHARPAIVKSERLHAAESDYVARIDAALRAMGGPESLGLPMDGPLAVHVIWCFPTGGVRQQGSPMCQTPDLDNMMKTFSDCLVRAGVIADDATICDERLTKVWEDPEGVWVEVAPIPG